MPLDAQPFLTRRNRAAVAVAYEEVEEQVRAVARRVWREYGGDLEEMQADARLLFCDAYRRFGTAWGDDFAVWVRFFVRKRLLEDVRTRERRKRIMRPRLLPPDMAAPDRSSFRMFELRDALSLDGRTVLRMVMAHPDLLAELADDRGTPYGMRIGVRRYLRNLGWGRDRINATFQEIREALK